MRVLILGAGPAGLSAAERLRELESERGRRDIDIHMVSDEPFPPYSPPAMADHFLNGRDTTLYWKGRDILGRLGVVYHAGRKTAQVDPAGRRVRMADGESIDYDRLVIATGSRLYAPLPGVELEGVYNFKSLSAAKRLVARAREGKVKRALIIGAGFIGVEVALVLRDLGLDVTMVSRRWVMPRMLDAETGAIVLEALQARGVKVRMDIAAEALEGDMRVEALRLATGERLSADVYVAATGVKPNVDYLRDSGLAMDWGVQVDDNLRTSHPGIYAAGDVAETRDRLTGERYVHAIFPNAVSQGRVVAEHLLGYETVYPGAESMNSLRHLGVPLVAVGQQKGEVLRMRAGGVLRKLFLDQGRITGFRLVGDIRGAGVYRELMLKQADVSAYGRRLLDPTFGFGAVVEAAMLIRHSMGPAH
jgi:NAD(P)H-nitrite reductase large subunit